MQISRHRVVRVSIFSPQCMEIMDFFLQHPKLYHTPITVSLALERHTTTVRTCMSLLKRNSYLTKVSEFGTVFHITKENMEFWVTDFRRHVQQLAELKQHD